MLEPLRDDSPARDHNDTSNPLTLELALTLNLDRETALFRHATTVLARISRTFDGESNTDISQDKPPLLVSGEDLKNKVAENFINAAAFAHSSLKAGVTSSADMQRVIYITTFHANRGLVDHAAGFFRSWPGHSGQPAPPELPQAFSDFSRTLFEKLSQGTDKIEVAAWIEHTFNAQIHPLSDGCGRVSKALSTAVLAIEGKSYPAFASRDEYFSFLLRPLGEFAAKYREKAV